jgi:acyl transferase domain-containing protein
MTDEPHAGSSTEPPPPPRGTAEPIAIIGIGCRFPRASGPDAFWRLVSEGIDAISEVPADRFDIQRLHDPRPATPGKLISGAGGFLDHGDRFDNAFFDISPREATRMDPQQRLLLEVGWEALEDAGLVPGRLAGSATGVFVGLCTSDYEGLQFLRADPRTIDLYVSTGSARSIASGRLSYALDLRGPSLTVDTACSSSLVAVHLACRSLQTGECTLALAGGTNLILTPEFSLGFSNANMLAADGRCKFGDSRADGFVRSDGVGVVVLKPLARALDDRDPVYAVIRGSAVNNDGRASGFLATPGRQGQEAVLRQAYGAAGISPGAVQYVEAHGTGTSVGDPVEVEALAAVLQTDRAPGRRCLLGSIKTNFGHAEGAAGVAGLIKVALALKHRSIPPSLHVEELNPAIRWAELPLAIQRELTPWPASPDGAFAGVSGFGISGTNAHLVLEGISTAGEGASGVSTDVPDAHLLVLSGQSRDAVQALARSYRDMLAQPERPFALRDLSYTTIRRRTHHEHRLAVVAHSHQEAAEQLSAFLDGESRPGMSASPEIPKQHKVVFVFPGQGSQWLGMGRELVEREPVFRDSLVECDRALRPYCEWSLFDELLAPEGRSRLAEIDVVQPVLFAIEVALAALWRSWGIEPDAVVGHSMGEIAAAYVAGALSLDDATRVICRRSRLLRRKSGQGMMAVVEVPLETAREIIAGYEDRVAIAVSNSCVSTVLSGDAAALREIVGRLQERDIFCKAVKVDVASHSPQMDDLSGELLEALDGMRPRAARIPLYSTVRGGLAQGLEMGPAYWVANLREPVLFSTAVDELMASGHDLFIEISPHPILLGALQQASRHSGKTALALPSLRREEGERAVLLGSLGALHTAGVAIEWNRLYPDGMTCQELPPYAWQRERFWRDDVDRLVGDARIHRDAAACQTGSGAAHPWLERPVASAVHPGTRLWRFDLDTRACSSLADHRVQGMIVVAAAAFVEMALSAASEVFDDGPRILEDVSFSKALFLPYEGVVQGQLVLQSTAADCATFQIFSRPGEAGTSHGEAWAGEGWTLHASGRIRSSRPASDAPGAVATPLPAIVARLGDMVSATEHYGAMSARGLDYGPSFQGVEQLWSGDCEALGQIGLPAAAAPDADRYAIHPALLDACFQVLAGTIPDVAGDSNGATFVPVGIKTLKVFRAAGPTLWAHASLRGAGTDAGRSRAELKGDAFEGQLVVYDQSGSPVIDLSGMRVERLERERRETSRDLLSDSLYEIDWKPAPPSGEPRPERLSEDERGVWLILADDAGVAEVLTDALARRGDRTVMVRPGRAFHTGARAPGFDGTAAHRYDLDAAQPGGMLQIVSEMSSAEGDRWKGIVHLWSLDATASDELSIESLEAAQRAGCDSLLHLVHALTTLKMPPPVWLVTRGAQPVGDQQSLAVAQSPIWGFGRSLIHEHPELAVRMIDLDPAGSEAGGADLVAELVAADRERQVAWRGGTRYVARLVRSSRGEEDAGTRNASVVVSGEDPYRLQIPKAGVLDNLTLRATRRGTPAPGTVEVRVRAAGVNFSDVMIAMGIYPGQAAELPSLGLECSGEITAIGEGVRGLDLGDQVIAVGRNCFGSYANVDAALVFPKPIDLSFESAATIPIAYLTAFYALHDLGRMSRGKRVLIHAATGGVGLAAVQLARRAGAEVFATAGSAEKRAYLRSIGVEHVMDSRSLDFADETLHATGGEGVDIVLNSLAGEAIQKGLSVLRRYGRFLEIGKRDIYRNSQIGLLPFRKNLSFFAIDMEQLIFQERDRLAGMLRQILPAIGEGRLEPLPTQVFPASEAAGAFRHLAQARHIGKVILSFHEPVLTVGAAPEPTVEFARDATYLVTGGLGGLGLSISRWMVERGARHLVLVGRTRASQAVMEEVAALEAAGARVALATGNVADERDVARIVGEMTASMPPLRGIVHAAGVLDDGIVVQLTPERFRNVTAPKILGAWNLHALTSTAALDFFVMCSSAASVLGSPGQANYTAANAFLDALARHRRGQGLAAQSINWGPWSEVGLAARPDRGGRLALRGMTSISPRQGVEILGELMRRDLPQAAVMPVDWNTWSRFYPETAGSPFFSELNLEQPARAAVADSRSRGGFARADVHAALPADRSGLLETYLAEQLARVLGTSASKIDRQRALIRLGMDSLMAVELKNRVEVDLQVSVPVAKLLGGSSIVQLTAVLLEQIDPQAERTQEAAMKPVLTGAPSALTRSSLVLSRSAGL